MKKQDADTVEKRKQLHNCDGLCYGGIDEKGNDVGICNCIDTCNETRKSEGKGTFVSALIVALLPIFLLGLLAYFLYVSI